MLPMPGVPMFKRATLVGLLLIAAQLFVAGHAQADGFSTALPKSGVAIAVWDGGSVLNLATLHPNARSVWVTPAGKFIGYIPAAPTFVNDDFLTLYPGGIVSAGTPMLVTISAGTAPPVAGPTPTPTPTPSSTPTAVVAPVPAHLEYIVNAEDSGFTSTSTGAPLAPAHSECSIDDQYSLGWGWLNGSEVTVVGTGVGTCAGWTYLYEPNAESNYWLEGQYVSAQAPVAQPTPIPAPTVTPPPAGGTVVYTCIDGTFEGWSGDTVFELCNGQVWVQSGYAYTYHYAYRPDVTLVQTTAGWVMSVEGVSDSISVVQVAFVRTCINGAFDGWSGDTIFNLCNGQVWQQAEFNYHYHYAFRPDVLIYQSPAGGYRMQVDGVSKVIRVTRIQ